MLPALPTDSWLASEANRRQMRRARKLRRSILGRWSLHSTRRPRRGEVQCRRAELSVGGGLRRRRDARQQSRLLLSVYDDAGNVIETHEHVGDFKEP
jgi:hypothetical protein